MKFLSIFLLCLFISSLSFGQNVETLIKEGDDLRTAGEYDSAIAKYQEVLKIDPNNADALWKIGKAYTDKGDGLPANQKNEKKALFDKSIEYCQRAIAVDSKKAEAHFNLAVAIGRKALLVNILQRVGPAKEVKKELEITIQLDPNHDGAYHALARWHRKAPGIVGGKKEEAINNYLKAIQIKPNYIEHRLELAKAYISDRKDKASAKSQLEIAVTIAPENEVEKRRLKEAQEFLNVLKSGDDKALDELMKRIDAE